MASSREEYNLMMYWQGTVQKAPVLPLSVLRPYYSWNWEPSPYYSKGLSWPYIYSWLDYTGNKGLVILLSMLPYLSIGGRVSQKEVLSWLKAWPPTIE